MLTPHPLERFSSSLSFSTNRTLIQILPSENICLFVRSIITSIINVFKNINKNMLRLCLQETLLITNVFK